MVQLTPTTPSIQVGLIDEPETSTPDQISIGSPEVKATLESPRKIESHLSVSNIAVKPQ